MNDAAVIAEIVGGVALLLWATRMVRRAIERAASTRIRSIIGASLKNRVRACAVGGGTALALQSSRLPWP